MEERVDRDTSERRAVFSSKCREVPCRSLVNCRASSGMYWHSWYSSLDGDQAQTTDAVCFRAKHLVDRKKETTVWSSSGGSGSGPFHATAASECPPRGSFLCAATRGHAAAPACAVGWAVE